MDLVLFDLDNTLIEGDSDYEWGKFILSKIPEQEREPLLKSNLLFYQQYEQGTLDMYAYMRFQFSLLARFPRKQLDLWLQDFQEQIILPRILYKARQHVKQHLDKNDLVAVVTATNTFVTHLIVKEIGIPFLIGSIAKTDDSGNFTGEIQGIPAFREHKITRVNLWLESIGIHWQSFHQSWFYSDSHNDLPLLQKVDHPIATNPDDTLHNYAKQKQWTILQLKSN